MRFSRTLISVIARMPRRPRPCGLCSRPRSEGARYHVLVSMLYVSKDKSGSTRGGNEHLHVAFGKWNIQRQSWFQMRLVRNLQNSALFLADSFWGSEVASSSSLCSLGNKAANHSVPSTHTADARHSSHLNRLRSHARLRPVTEIWDWLTGFYQVWSWAGGNLPRACGLQGGVRDFWGGRRGEGGKECWKSSKRVLGTRVLTLSIITDIQGFYF